MTKESTTKITDYGFPNPHGFEVLAVCARVAHIKEKFYIIAGYIPPNYMVSKGKSCLEHINNLVLDIKRRADNDRVIIAGDFNQWGIGEALLDYADISEVETPPTRGERRIDRIFTNFPDLINEAS